MRLTRQELFCSELECKSSVAIELCGVHEVRSTSLLLIQVAYDAGWDVDKAACPAHSNSFRRRERPVA